MLIQSLQKWDRQHPRKQVLILEKRFEMTAFPILFYQFGGMNYQFGLKNYQFGINSEKPFINSVECSESFR